MATFLVRMVTAAKWRRTIEGEICADTVIADLKTQNNTLSFWMCVSEKGRPSRDELRNVVIALAAGRNSVEKLDIICLSEQDIASRQIEINETKGLTPTVQVIKELHRDLASITLPKLVKISDLIHSEVSRDGLICFTKGQIKNILQNAIDQNLLETEGLKSKLSTSLGLNGE